MFHDDLMQVDSDYLKSVLVVDDNEQVRDLLSRWLVRDGWECLQASDADMALQIVQATEVPIVVADINMSGHSGLWLLEQITNQFSSTSVLMLTASSDTLTAIEALNRGATGYMLKPILREDFLFHVRQTEERRRLIQDRRKYLQSLEQRVQEQTQAIRLAHEETIHRLVTAAACRDEETGAHIRRTGLLSETVALASGWSPTESEHLRMAAPMHDVGKIGIPDAILRKPGQLTDQEFEQMKQHTVIGARMLAGSSSPILQLAEKIALSHHERWDGKGYPMGISGEAIPEAARILSIVDVYDALSHDRVYRPALPEEHVLAIMQDGYGSQFDPRLLTVFFTVFEELRTIAASHPDETKIPSYEIDVSVEQFLRGAEVPAIYA